MAWIPFRLKMTILSTLPMGLHTVYKTSWNEKKINIHHNQKLSKAAVCLNLHGVQASGHCAFHEYRIHVGTVAGERELELNVD